MRYDDDEVGEEDLQHKKHRLPDLYGDQVLNPDADAPSSSESDDGDELPAGKDHVLNFQGCTVRLLMSLQPSAVANTLGCGRLHFYCIIANLLTNIRLKCQSTHVQNDVDLRNTE